MKNLRYGFHILVYYFLVRSLEEILSWKKIPLLEKESIRRLKCRLKAETSYNGSILAVHYLADPLKTADLDAKAKSLFRQGKGFSDLPVFLNESDIGFKRIEITLKRLLFSMSKIIIFWVSKIQKLKLFHFSSMTLWQTLFGILYRPKVFNLMEHLFSIYCRRFMMVIIQMLNGHFSSDKESKIEHTPGKRTSAQINFGTNH